MSDLDTPNTPPLPVTISTTGNSPAPGTCAAPLPALDDLWDRAFDMVSADSTLSEAQQWEGMRRLVTSMHRAALAAKDAQAVALRDQAVQQARKEECDRLDKWWREEWRKLEQQHALDITNLNAQYAPLVAAWKEWKRAANAFHDNPSDATRRHLSEAEYQLAAVEDV